MIQAINPRSTGQSARGQTEQDMFTDSREVGLPASQMARSHPGGTGASGRLRNNDSVQRRKSR